MGQREQKHQLRALEGGALNKEAVQPEQAEWEDESNNWSSKEERNEGKIQGREAGLDNTLQTGPLACKGRS